MSKPTWAVNRPKKLYHIRTIFIPKGRFVLERWQNDALLLLRGSCGLDLGWNTLGSDRLRSSPPCDFGHICKSLLPLKPVLGIFPAWNFTYSHIAGAACLGEGFVPRLFSKEDYLFLRRIAGEKIWPDMAALLAVLYCHKRGGCNQLLWLWVYGRGYR